MKNILIVF